MSKFVTQTGIERLIAIIKSELNNKAATSHTHNGLKDGSGNYTIETPTTSMNATFLTSLDKGAANGLAPLNSNSKIDSTYLPSYVDDVIEGYYYNSAFYEESTHTTLITGETDKIYIDLATNKTYRYGGSAYVEIGSAQLKITELTDTNITNPANGQALLYDSGSQKWVNGTVSTGSSSLNTLTDTNITSVADGQLLQYSSTDSKWINATPNFAPSTHTHDSLKGAEGTYTLSAPTLTGNATISIDGHTHSGYVPTSRTVAGKALTSNITIALDDLSDSAITSAATGQILRYNGTNFVNADLSTANVLIANKMSAADMNTLWGSTAASAYTE